MMICAIARSLQDISRMPSNELASGEIMYMYTVTRHKSLKVKQWLGLRKKDFS